MRKIMSIVWSALISAVIFIGLALVNLTQTMESILGDVTGEVSAYELLGSDYQNNSDFAFFRVMTIILIVVGAIMALVAVLQLVSLFVKDVNKLPIDAIAKCVAILCMVVAIVFFISACVTAGNLSDETLKITCSISVGPILVLAVTAVATALQFINAKIFKK